MLTLDGTKIATKSIKVAAGNTEMVTFSVVRDLAGIYRLKLGKLFGILVVKDQLGLPSGYIIDKKSLYADDQIEVSDITYMSDGLRIKGYLAQPKARGRYPAVIWNRGGNRDFGLLNPDFLKIYAQNGFVTIGSQYRGNGGSEGKEEFGGADVNDVLNLIPALKSLSNVDADRIGMVGYSRGGRMTYNTLKEQTLRGINDIKAACTVAGTTDLFMQADKRPMQLKDVMIPLIGGSPSQVPEEYEARSAVYWADKINVPLLIQHGEADDRVSVEQSEKLAQELDKYGKVYKLITYPDDDHSLSANMGGRPEIFKWFRQYLR
ncbi:alpha/beta hydrolase family protein [Chloroflexota bacterium]